MNITKTVFALLLAGCWLGCDDRSNSTAQQSRPAQPAAPNPLPDAPAVAPPEAPPDVRAAENARVKIDGAGRIFLNGNPVSLEELETELARLAEARGVVRYYRENPGADPPSEVAAVVQSVIGAITEAKLPVKLETRDFEQARDKP